MIVFSVLYPKSAVPKMLVQDQRKAIVAQVHA